MSTKEEILEAAVRVFSNYGYHKATMDMIAREAKVAKGTLYWHFASKHELFVGLVKNDLDQFYSYLERIRNSEVMSSREKLEAILENRFDFLQRHQTVMREVMNHKEEVGCGMAGSIQELRAKHIQLLADIFAEGAKNGEFALEDPMIVATAFLGMSISIAAYRENVAELDQETTTRVLRDLILHGVLNRKS